MAFEGGLSSSTGIRVFNYFPDTRCCVQEKTKTGAIKVGCIQTKLDNGPKKTSKVKLMRERIRQFSIWFFENEEQKEIEHVRRRKERKKEKIYKMKVCAFHWLKWLYRVDVILWIVGLIFTLCSSVKALGQYTIFYRKRQLYQVLGPCVLLLATVLLLLATGFSHRLSSKYANRPQRNFYIVQKKKKSLKRYTEMKDQDNHSDYEDDIEKKVTCQHELRRVESIEEMDELALTKCKIRQETGKSGKFALEYTELVNQPTVGRHGVHISSAKGRQAWTRTKWMTVDTDSEESLELGDIFDLTNNYFAEELQKVETGGSTSAIEDNLDELHTQSVLGTGNIRKPTLHPIMRNCFTRSSTESQSSAVSSISTTSESAPLVRT